MNNKVSFHSTPVKYYKGIYYLIQHKSLALKNTLISVDFGTVA